MQSRLTPLAAETFRDDVSYTDATGLRALRGAAPARGQVLLAISRNVGIGAFVVAIRSG